MAVSAASANAICHARARGFFYVAIHAAPDRKNECPCIAPNPRLFQTDGRGRIDVVVECVHDVLDYFLTLDAVPGFVQRR